MATSTIRNSEPFTPLALPVELKVTHAVRNFGMARAFKLEVTRAVRDFGMALSVEFEVEPNRFNFVSQLRVLLQGAMECLGTLVRVDAGQFPHHIEVGMRGNDFGVPGFQIEPRLSAVALCQRLAP